LKAIVVILFVLGLTTMATKKWKEKNVDKLRKYRRQWYSRNKAQAKSKIYERKNEIKNWFNEYKKTLKCEKCGEDRWYVLEFHHKDPSIKDVGLSRACADGWSKKRILEEVDKCDIFCANCHRETHFILTNKI